jgi:enoyl-CoA hydratase/carnithine racemase
VGRGLNSLGPAQELAQGGTIVIRYEARDRIAYITLSRPEKLNALRDEDIEELVERIRDFDADDTADVAILSGDGRCFCAGVDVKARLLASADAGVKSQYRPSESEAFLHCVNYKPIIAAVHGYVLGHALGTAMTCDFIVAAPDARFQATEVTLGIPLPGMWAQIAYMAGPVFANDVMMTGRAFGSEEALRVGFVTSVTAEGGHIAGAEQLAASLLANSQVAVRELVRCRRSIVAENLLHARSIAGTFRWDLSKDFRSAIEAKAK